MLEKGTETEEASPSFLKKKEKSVSTEPLPVFQLNSKILSLTYTKRLAPPNLSVEDTTCQPPLRAGSIDAASS